MALRFHIKAVPATAAVALVLSLLPARWIAPWSADLSAILWIPLMPAAHVLAGARAWLRPPMGPGVIDAGSAARIQEERDHYRGLWHSERLRVADLESQLRLVATLSQRSGSEEGLVVARVVREGDSARASLIDAGTAHGVQGGNPVIALGEVLLGRVAANPDRWSCIMEPINSPSIGRIEAVITPSEAGGMASASRRRSIRVQLAVDSDGFWAGDIDAGSEVDLGDEVRLDDPTWPASARGLRLGAIAWIGRKDEQPLRGQTLVRPALDCSRVAQVVIRTNPPQEQPP